MNINNDCTYHCRDCEWIGENPDKEYWEDEIYQIVCPECGKDLYDENEESL